MDWRERLGRWLWPDGVRAEADLCALRSNIADVWWWGVSEEACLTAAWLRNHDKWRAMTNEKIAAETAERLWPAHALRADVGRFREWMGTLSPEAAAAAVRTERDRLGGKSPYPPLSSEASPLGAEPGSSANDRGREELKPLTNQPPTRERQAEGGETP